MTDDSKARPPRRASTRLLHAGREKSITGQFVNPPVVHASTVLFPTVEDMHKGRLPYNYGRLGTPTSEALELAVNELEGADGSVLCPSGLAAATIALLSVLSAGDHVLVTDSVYGPVRRLMDGLLHRFGVEATYYEPSVGAGIAALFRPNTRAVYTESPGSLTFEMQDVPAIAAVAHERNALVLFDNTWATPLHFRAFDHGVDVSIIAGTKYLGGHADVMLGTVSARGARVGPLKQTHRDMGMHVGPDDMYLALRGIRTLPIRMEHHVRSALAIATWLQGRPEVARVLYPALPGDAGHALWKRDMTGASGLFGVVMRGWSEAQAMRFVDSLELFGIGASWGGYESLATVPQLAGIRTVQPWHAEGALVRLHIGLEDPADLMADLESGLAAAAA